MTIDEFLAWDPQDGRVWQLIDGEPRRMPPANEAHGLLQAEIGGRLGNHLLSCGSPCAVLIGPAVRPHVFARRNVRIADVAVTAAPPQAGRIFIELPVVLIEVLGRGIDRMTWSNVWAYTTIPSVQEILCVRQDRIEVELLRRGPDGSWPDDPDRIEHGPLHLASIGFTCDVASLYRTTHLSHAS